MPAYPTPPECEVGATVAGREFEMTLARVLAFSGGAFDEPGWPQRNLHTDREKAREAGLDHIIASGTQSEGLLIGLMVDVFGAAWHEHGWLDLRFVKPVRVGDKVRPMLRWTGSQIDASETRYAATCWCENGAGERVIDGTASCALPSSRASGR
jgi:3-hydroxybutyryl-CoA dehydratase